MIIIVSPFLTYIYHISMNLDYYAHTIYQISMNLDYYANFLY